MGSSRQCEEIHDTIATRERLRREDESRREIKSFSRCYCIMNFFALRREDESRREIRRESISRKGGTKQTEAAERNRKRATTDQKEAKQGRTNTSNDTDSTKGQRSTRKRKHHLARSCANETSPSRGTNTLMVDFMLVRTAVRC